MFVNDVCIPNAQWGWPIYLHLLGSCVGKCRLSIYDTLIIWESCMYIHIYSYMWFEKTYIHIYVCDKHIRYIYIYMCDKPTWETWTYSKTEKEKTHQPTALILGGSFQLFVFGCDFLLQIPPWLGWILLVECSKLHHKYQLRYLDVKHVDFCQSTNPNFWYVANFGESFLFAKVQGGPSHKRSYSPYK